MLPIKRVATALGLLLLAASLFSQTALHIRSREDTAAHSRVIGDPSTLSVAHFHVVMDLPIASCAASERQAGFDGISGG